KPGGVHQFPFYIQIFSWIVCGRVYEREGALSILWFIESARFAKHDGRGWCRQSANIGQLQEDTPVQTAQKPATSTSPPTASAVDKRTLLMIPGPTQISSEVLAAGARPVLAHGDPIFRQTVGEILA